MPIPKLLALFLAVTLLHCAGSWSLPLLDRDEPRFAEASREMLASGDYVVPRFNGQLRLDKPALIYWLQTGACRVFGVNEFAVRFPSAVCAALVAVMLAIWGARMFDAATGWRAALIFSTCLQVFVHARAAVADLAMVACVVGAAWAIYEWRRSEVNGGWLPAIAGGAALGLGFLAKGPIALLPLGMLWWGGLPASPQPRRVFVQGCAVFLVALAIVAAWGIPALRATDGAFFSVGLGKHVVARAVSPLEGHGSGHLLGYLAMLPFFAITVWPSFFPWSIWLVPSLRRAWKSAARGSGERFLLTGVLLCFAIFTLYRTKLPHYTLPAFPFLALLVAAWWRDGATFRRTLLATSAAALALFLIGAPLAARAFPVEQLYREAEPLLRADMALACYDFDEPSVVWTFRRKLTAFREKLDDDEVAPWLSQPGDRVLILPADKLGPLPPGEWRVFRASGWHFVKGRRLTLALVVGSAAGGVVTSR